MSEDAYLTEEEVVTQLKQEIEALLAEGAALTELLEGSFLGTLVYHAPNPAEIQRAMDSIKGRFSFEPAVLTPAERREAFLERWCIRPTKPRREDNVLYVDFGRRAKG